MVSTEDNYVTAQEHLKKTAEGEADAMEEKWTGVWH